jgi:uncharacterized protein (TIGR00297 family)
MDILLIILVSLGISVYIYKLDKLTSDGASLLFIILSSLYITGGLLFFSSFVIFILSITFLMDYKKEAKELLTKIHSKKDNKIDIVQVAANGIPSLIMAILYLLSENEMFIVAFCITVAGSTANMWASEIGATSKKDPISITSFKPIRKGISGGVSWLGILASFLGSLLIAVIFILFNINSINNLILINASFILAGGFLCSIFDSLFGGLLQAKYIDHETGLLTEVANYNDIDNKKVKGSKLFGNNLIEFISLLCISVAYIIIKTIS